MHISCFWISERYKGEDYANRLLEECTQGVKSKSRYGPIVAASERKRPFLSDLDYLEYKSFSAVDIVAPFFVPYYLPLSGNVLVPRLQDCVKWSKTEEKNMILYHINQRPHIDKYVPVIANLAEERGVRVSVYKIETIGRA